jgi:hypothetical protein
MRDCAGFAAGSRPPTVAQRGNLELHDGSSARLAAPFLQHVGDGLHRDFGASPQEAAGGRARPRLGEHEGGEDVACTHGRDAFHASRHGKMLAFGPDTADAIRDDELRKSTDTPSQGHQLLRRFRCHRREILATGDQQVELAQRLDESGSERGQRKRPDRPVRIGRPQEALQDGAARRCRVETQEVVRRHLVGDWRNQDGSRRGDRIEARKADLATAALQPEASAYGRVAMNERGRGVRLRGIDPGRQAAQLFQPGLSLGLGSGDRHDRHAQAARRGGPGDVQDRTTGNGGAIGEAIDGQGADHQQVGPGGYHRAIMKLFFYELHEGATDLLTDAVLVTDQEYTPEAFASLVLAARAAVVDTFEEDTLVEAIARELERSHGFTYAGDEKLTASMSVGMDEADTYLVETSDEFRSVIAEVDLSS